MSLNFAGVNFWHFKLRLLDRPNIIHSLEYLRSTPLGCKDKIRVCGKDSIPFQTFEKCITRPQFRVVILVLGHPVEQTIW